MDIIKEITILKAINGLKNIEKQLQNINKMVVTDYMCELSNGLMIYPIEVESYYENFNFSDEFVHKNILQKDRFGKFYIHRTVKTQESKYKKGTREGIDICLSDNSEFHYGMLIRSAIFSNGNIIFGPSNVCKFIRENSEVSPEKLEDEVVLKNVTQDCRDNKSVILHSNRIGLGNKEYSDYKNLHLRTISGFLHSSTMPFKYKKKEEVFKNFMKENNFSIKEAEDMSIKILGYRVKSLLKDK